jgi:hypothetical protein
MKGGWIIAVTRAHVTGISPLPFISYISSPKPHQMTRAFIFPASDTAAWLSL